MSKMFVTQAPWYNDIVFEFIELYKSERMLWDPKHKDHKNKGALNAAWERIRQKITIECSVVDLKKKKESLMTTYRLLVRKKYSNPDYQVTWFAFEVINSFLENVYVPEEVANAEQELSSQSEDYTYKLHSNRKIKRERTSSVSENVSAPMSKYSTPKKRTSEIPHSCIQMPESADRNEMDECDLYTQLLAKKLRRLDERERDIIMHEIDNIMFRAKMKSDERKGHCSSSSVFIENDDEQFVTEYLEDPIHD